MLYVNKMNMAYKGLKFLLILVILNSLFDELRAYEFQVGGKNGWVITPSEKYNHWAERLRFQVNDTLLFRYKKGTDSVLLVNQADYDKCNTKNPITTMDGGDSIFKFDRSGPFFFISGTQDHCDKGQKLIIVVLAVRHKSPPIAQAPTPVSVPVSTPVSAVGPSADGPDLSSTPTTMSPSSSPHDTPGSTTSPSRSAGDVLTPSVMFLLAVTVFGSLIA